MTYLILSCCVVAACLVTCSKVGGIRKWLGYAVALDVAFTMLLLWAFAGTFAGMIVATLAGLIMAVVLSALKAILGYERIVRENFRWQWKQYPPAWKPRIPKVKIVMEDE